MRIDVMTLFPSMFSPLKESILGRAQERSLLNIQLWDIRNFAADKHRIVDDTPYGGGAGMVLKPDVLVKCIEHVRRLNDGPVIFVTPQGKVFNQSIANCLAQLPSFSLLCGHYEGIDERVRQHWIDEEISIGDYVLTGGELPAMIIIDAVARLIPGVLGDSASFQMDSFADGLLEHPHYTRPAVYRGYAVPEILLSGNHGEIARWRLKESLRRTVERRPDLLANRLFTNLEKQLLAEIEAEDKGEGR